MSGPNTPHPSVERIRRMALRSVKHQTLRCSGRTATDEARVVAEEGAMAKHSQAWWRAVGVRGSWTRVMGTGRRGIHAAEIEECETTARRLVVQRERAVLLLNVFRTDSYSGHLVRPARHCRGNRTRARSTCVKSLKRQTSKVRNVPKQRGTCVTTE